MMKKSQTRILSLLLAGACILTSIHPALACGPDFDSAIMVSGTHPDLPLSKFAAGTLGVIQNSWAKSYLLVSYRYLTGNPLDKNEQESIVNRWRERLSHGPLMYSTAHEGIDPASQYLLLRARVLKLKIQPQWPSKFDYDFSESISDAAFANATVILKALIKKYGQGSSEVKTWLKAQDDLFGNNTKKEQRPVKLNQSLKDSFTKACNEYQVAASLFYREDLKQAKAAFEHLSSKGIALFSELAAYMAARCSVDLASSAGSNTPEFQKSTFALINTFAAKFPAGRFKSDWESLYQRLMYQAQPETRSIDYLAKEICKPHSKRFGNNVGDFTFLIDEGKDTSEPDESRFKTDASDTSKKNDEANTGKAKIGPYSDITDWVSTIQIQDYDYDYSTDADKKKIENERVLAAAHSMDKWKQTHKLQWLIAALSTNRLSRTKTPELFNATEKIAPGSPAYLTASAYLIGASLAAGDKQAAHQRIMECLSIKELPPSARNIFLSQRIAASGSLAEYLKSVTQKPAVVTIDTDMADLSPKWADLEAGNRYNAEECTVTDLQAKQIDADLPYAEWIKWAKDKSVPSPLHKRLVQSTWMRSLLLGQDSGLEGELAASYPNIARYMPAYKAASGAEKRFKLSKLILHNVGMTPYLGGAIERHHQAIDVFDYYNANFWLPYDESIEWKLHADKVNGEYTWPDILATFRVAQMMKEAAVKPGKEARLNKLLSNDQLRQAKIERQAIFKNHPSKFLGDPVIEWSKSHPSDPDVPELLYKIVRLPKWTGVTPVGSSYSRKAYDILHKNYPKSKWTKQAVCWY